MKILHLVSQQNQKKDLSEKIIRNQMSDSSHEVQVIDLAQNPDYGKIVRDIFESDSVHVW
jgi:hypothetical protein